VSAVALVILLFGVGGDAASDHYGRVTFGGLPVPGASVTATRGDRTVATVTGQDGVFHLSELDDGVWSFRVEMPGFAPAAQDITIDASAPPSTWILKLLSLDEMTRTAQTVTTTDRATAERAETNQRSGAQPERPAAGRNRAAGTPAAPASPQSGFQRAQVNPAGNAALANDPSASADADRGGSDGFLINGSVNNGAASPFAQLAAFGNNRRNARSLYNGGIGVLLGNSALDSAPYSFTGQSSPKPSYNDAQIVASLAGPLRIPNLLRNGPNMFLGYQRTIDHNASTQSALMPTALERSGDFSQTRDALGRVIQLIDPDTGRPFPGNVIPSARLSSQAESLLNYYPLPNLVAGGRFNYQTPVLEARHQDAVQARLSQMLSGGKNQLFGLLALQRTTTDTGNVFGFTDSTRASGIDTNVNWSHRFSQLLSMRVRYQFTRLTNDVTPYFANRINVSGEAGITGNDQTPVNWGAPKLQFSSGVSGLGSPQAAANTNTTQGGGAEIMSTHGRHVITVGGDVRQQRWNILSQQDARGAFTFSGSITGSDVADFMLGRPHSSSIAFGNADKDFTAPAYDAYLTDDWRVSPILTVNAGVRWEYEAPIDERLGRLSNLQVTPGFTEVQQVKGNGLIDGDPRGVQPRVGIALRPVAGSSLVIRAGYGIYRNTGVYQPIASLLAQQPPLSKTVSTETSAANVLTLANGFTEPPGEMLNTFAVDPDLRVGFAQNWQVLAQRDLPASLTITATYLGTHGSHLLQEFLPNTVPVGATSSCLTCPAGYVYLTSNGHSDRQTGQVQLRRRLRNGFLASVQYALSKAMDDAGAFTGVSLVGSAIAQDWQHLEAEWALSNFDQRHLLTAQLQYTSGAGVSGGGMLDGAAAKFLRGWTITTQLTAGSGFPLTPIYPTSVPGTGVTGSLRANVTGVSGDPPDGYYANPLAYVTPAPGQWGNAGRNSITGPRQFSMDASIGRTFMWGDRLNLDWRLNATNILNRVTFAAVNTFVGSTQFGLPTIANPMRKVQASIRLRF
jgi:carboxypeptidase family protein